MRVALLVLSLLGLVAFVRAGSFADPDDAALMEIGVDLSAEARAQPTPTFVFNVPDNHRIPLMAQFPLVHEIAGVEAQDWKDIQGLLTREPQVAEESSVDMKLDELEEQFKRVDAISTAAPAVQPRMAQVGSAQPKAPATASAKATAAAPRALPKVKSAQPKAPATASAAANAGVRKPIVKAAAAAAAPAAAATAAPAPSAAAATTARLIEKRIRGLAILFKRFKSQTGVSKGSKSNKRVEDALAKQKKDAAALKKRLANKGIVRFAQEGQDDSAFVESEAEMESEVESEAEVAADAEAIDGILDTLM